MRKGVFGITAALVFGAAVASQAGDSWIGTWKLNAAKSKAAEGTLQAQTIKFEETAGGIKLTSEGVDAQGQKVSTGYTAKFDGTEAAWTGNPLADSAAPKRIDANNYENVWKKAGKTTVSAKVSVSADGKTLTVTQHGTDAAGKKVESVAVYDRQ
jgi:hypothetical protein